MERPVNRRSIIVTSLQRPCHGLSVVGKSRRVLDTKATAHSNCVVASNPVPVPLSKHVLLSSHAIIIYLAYLNTGAADDRSNRRLPVPFL